jgi:Uma2 family endonuclease
MMTLAQAPVRYTEDELLRAQSEGGVEFVDGELVEKPVSIDSARIEVRIATLLSSDAAKFATAEVFTSSMGYQCFPGEPRKFRKPDVSVVRSERLAGLDPQTGLIPFAPDLAVEVLSPDDLAYDIGEKIEDYLANGFPLIWVVQPNTRTVTVYRGDGSGKRLHEQDEITADSALPTFRCKVAEFFLTVAVVVAQPR